MRSLPHGKGRGVPIGRHVQSAWSHDDHRRDNPELNPDYAAAASSRHARRDAYLCGTQWVQIVLGRLGSAVGTVASDQDLDFRPAGADHPYQVAQHQHHLGAVRRIARPQDHRDRLTGTSPRRGAPYRVPGMTDGQIARPVVLVAIWILQAGTAFPRPVTRLPATLSVVIRCSSSHARSCRAA